MSISSWNVRSGCSLEQQERIVFMLGKQNIDICAVQELRLKNNGIKEYILHDELNKENYKYTLTYSGHPQGGHHGVGLFFRSEKRTYLQDWGFSTKFPARILWVKFDACIYISFYGFTETSRKTNSIQLLQEKESLCCNEKSPKRDFRFSKIDSIKIKER